MLLNTYHCHQMAHVPCNRSIDFFISGRFYYDGDIFGLRK